MIHLNNSRTRRKEPFTPIDPANVRMYVCGPTVYDRAHIGNARPVVVFDVLYRLLRHQYGADHVTYVRNFTDVDDRIIARAQETLREGETLEAATRRITDETIGWYHEDMGALGALPPSHEPRCTEYIPQMVEMTAELIRKRHAYEAEGHVLFAVDSYDRYGALSGRSVDDMIAGSRVEVAPYKRNPMDFVLWKPSTPEQPGWESPWGRGRPGWHIECSAMARALLGEVFDIHGGGIDLQFPHHENELAQSCCAHDTDRMAQVWMHNGFLQVEGEKMAKSLGNFFTVKDLRDRGIPGEVIRFVLLSTHYRAPLDWTERRLLEAEWTLKGWYAATDGVEQDKSELFHIKNLLGNDLGTPEVLSWLHQLNTHGVNSKLKAALGFLGFPNAEDRDWWREKKGRMTGVSWSGSHPRAEEVLPLVERWADLRATRRYAEADALRDKIVSAGVKLEARGGMAAHADILSNFDPSKLEALQ